jgi:hypothetical protein
MRLVQLTSTFADSRKHLKAELKYCPGRHDPSDDGIGNEDKGLSEMEDEGFGMRF